MSVYRQLSAAQPDGRIPRDTVSQKETRYRDLPDRGFRYSLCIRVYLFLYGMIEIGLPAFKADSPISIERRLKKICL